MGDVLDRMGADKPVVAVTEHLGEDRLLSGATGVSRHDPHVWMDVSVWMDGARTVAEVLSDFDPKNAQASQHNLEIYLAALHRHDHYVRETLGSVPETYRVLVTGHSA